MERPDFAFARNQLFFACAMGGLLAIFPYFWVPTRKTLGITLMVVLLGMVLLPGFRGKLSGRTQTTLSTELNALLIGVQTNLVGPIRMHRGGTLKRWGKSFLLITGDGDFYKLDWNKGDSLLAHRLALSLPRDDASSAPKREDSGGLNLGDHRITDALLDTTSDPPNVFVSHEEWNPTEKCYTVRISAAALLESGSPERKPVDSWKRVFESQPCQHMFIDPLETGGRLAWLGDKFLLTLGEFGLGPKVQPLLSQSENNDYGKVLLFDKSGQHEIFTMGHRNPQGLFIDGDQRIWLTEHGPKGGDELNLLKKGNNYGWPYATYGTAYGRYFWPFSPGAHNHGQFTEPSYAFVPSIGISNLIRVESPTFSEWKGDLLISSLGSMSLYRVRLRDERPIYAERIPIGFRIRDIAEGADGRIVLWTDEGALVVVSPGSSEPNGNAVFAGCAGCHETSGGSKPLAPSLRGIVGANVARESGFPYSSALLKLGGKWTEDRLDSFLSDPNSYAPGSAMESGQIPDPKIRRALIDVLKMYQ